MENLLKKRKHENNLKALSEWENYFSSDSDKLLVSKDNFTYHESVKNSQIMVHKGSDQDNPKGNFSVSHEALKVLSWKDITLEELTNLHEYDVTQKICENIAIPSPGNAFPNTSKILCNKDEAKSKDDYYRERYNLTIFEGGSPIEEKPSCTTKDCVQKNLDIDEDQSSIIDENFEQSIMAIFDQDFLFNSQTMLIPSQNNTGNQEMCILTQRSGNKETPSSSQLFTKCQGMINLSQDKLISTQNSTINQEICKKTQRCENKPIFAPSQSVADSQEMISLSQDISDTAEMIISSQQSCGSQTMIVSSQGSTGNETMIVSTQESYGSQTMIVSSQGSTGNETMIFSTQESNGGETMIVSSQDSIGGEKMIMSSQESSGIPKMIVSSQESLESMKMVISSQESLESQKINVTSPENAVSSQEMFANQVLGVPNYESLWISPNNPKSYTNKQVYLCNSQEKFHRFSSHNFNIRKRRKLNKYYLKPRKYLTSKADSLNKF